MPQLIIQAITLVCIIMESSDNSHSDDLLITIVTMIFTVISISLSVLEYVFESNPLKHKFAVFIRYNVISKHFANMSPIQFSKKFRLCPRKSNHIMAKMLGISGRLIQTLPPIQDKNGVTFSFILEIDNKMEYSQIQTEINNLVNDNSLAQVKLNVIFVHRYVSTFFLHDFVFVLNINSGDWTGLWTC